jgi:hypothetical protein
MTMLVSQLSFPLGQAETNLQATAPNLALKDLRGRTVRVGGYKGKVVLINFWATWCGPAKRNCPSCQITKGASGSRVANNRSHVSA